MEERGGEIILSIILRTEPASAALGRLGGVPMPMDRGEIPAFSFPVAA
jgi:hypothetical protein